jgi:tetratricopeptide (TPR) repeat protein
MAGKSLTLRAIRAHDDAQVPPRLGLRIVAVFLALEALLLLALSLIFAPHAGAATAPIKAEVSVSTSAGFARFVFRFAEDTDSEINLNNGILVIAFKTPVDISVDRIPIGAPDYVNAARRDPDGMAVRLALGRKVTANSMMAGDRLFVDLLPEGWVGLPPGLPQEVVDELARRAREAERKERERRQQDAAQKEQQPPIRVRVGTQPTFTRYVFELPQVTAVTTDRAKDKLTVLFDAPLRFYLADAQAALPPSVAMIEARPGGEKTAVHFEFKESPDVRTFREDNNFIVDVLAAEVRDHVADLTIAGNAKPAAPAPTEVSPALPRVAAERAPPPDPPAATPATAERPTAQPAAAPAGAVASKGADEPVAPDTAPAPSEAAAAPVAAPARPRDANAPVVVEVVRAGDALRLTFPFATQTPAAVFRRADAVWLVFDAAAPIDVSKLVTQSIGSVRSATVTRTREGQVVRIKVDRPRLTSLEADGATWTVSIGDLILDPTRPLAISRAATASPKASAVVPFDAPRQLHRLADPEVGDALLVVTALGPPRGFLRPQSFIEFQALASTHGVAIRPVADDIAVELAADKIVIGRPSGLTLSSASAGSGAAPDDPARPPSASFALDTQLWGFDREADFVRRQAELVRGAATAPDAERAGRRLDLARFYLARELHAEAKGVLDVVLAEDHPKDTAAPALVLRAIAAALMGRGAAVLKDLTNPAVGDQFDAPVWRAFAYAGQGKWPEAHQGFTNTEAAVATLPVELQRLVDRAALQAAIEMRDFTAAGNLLNGLESLGVPADLAPSVLVLKGRMAEGLGRVADALATYQAAAASADRPAAAQGLLRALVLKKGLGQIGRPDAINNLEGLAVTWRGDATEVEALQLLGHLYAEEGRYRDALSAMHTAISGRAEAELIRRIQDEAAATFDTLFLDGKGDALPPVEALSLFYDFRELTPVGRRGDEMIRRLADRLVSVDLLDQAAALLQHQVDHRLQGAARAQIATRLAVIYLLGRKADRALQTLQATRAADLPNEVRSQRLLLEARALSDTGRPNLALEVIANLQGREVDRLRADVLWAARRWREAGEQIEKLYGERWRDFTPLTGAERADILRAGLAYSLAEDVLGLDRFRQKYAAKMAEGPDKNAFAVAIDRAAVDSAEFAEIARKVSAADTLESFLRDVRARYPQAGPAEPPAATAGGQRPS